MEFIVGALVVLGFLAILTRFIIRDAFGEIRLPRIVDDSIGMWALRRITGRRLGERPRDDEPHAGPEFDPSASEATRAALGTISAAIAADPTRGPSAAAPTEFRATPARLAAVGAARVVVPSRRASVSRPVLQPRSVPSARLPRMVHPSLWSRLRSVVRSPGRASPVADPSPGPSGRILRRSLPGLAAAVTLGLVAIVGVAAILAPRERAGGVLAATGRPDTSGSAGPGRTSVAPRPVPGSAGPERSSRPSQITP